MMYIQTHYPLLVNFKNLLLTLACVSLQSEVLYNILKPTYFLIILPCQHNYDDLLIQRNTCTSPLLSLMSSCLQALLVVKLYFVASHTKTYTGFLCHFTQKPLLGLHAKLAPTVDFFSFVSGKTFSHK